MSTPELLHWFLLSMCFVGLGAVFWVRNLNHPFLVPVLFTASFLALYVGTLVSPAFLMIQGEALPATVQSVECQAGKKRFIHYLFIAGTQRIHDRSLDRPNNGNLSCEFLKAGDVGFVTYLPADPSVHLWGHPHERFFELLTFIPLVLLIFPIVLHSQRKRLRALYG